MRRIFGRWIAGGVLAGLLLAGPGLRAEGKWEFGVHYSRWSLDLIKPAIEDSLNDTVASDLKDRILDDIRADYPTLMETGYSQRTVFDSTGDNYGAEVRFYPGGGIRLVQRGLFPGEVDHEGQHSRGRVDPPAGGFGHPS